MSVEDIEARILADANRAAERIAVEADRRAEKILSEAKAAAEAAGAGILARARAESEERRQSKLSQARLRVRKEALTHKRRLIDQAFERACGALPAMDDGQYFTLLSGMIVAGAMPLDMELIFDEEDVKRLPEDFMSSLEPRLAAVTEGKITLSGETRRLGGGFVLRSGGVEVNGSIPALVRDLRNALEPGVIERLGIG